MLFVVFIHNLQYSSYDWHQIGSVSLEFIITSSQLLVILIIFNYWKKKQAHDLENPFELVRPMTVIFFSFLTIFFFCETAEQITAQFEEINDDLYQSDWYSYPLKVQKIIPTIMIGTQQEISVQGFGNLIFTRESFKRVSSFI